MSNLNKAKRTTASSQFARSAAAAFLIRDEDDTSDEDKKEAKRAPNEQLEALLGERFILTPGREIENLLPECVIEAVVRQADRKTQLGQLSLKREEYRNQRLGRFLDEKLSTSNKWGDKYGTLKDKTEFCGKAIAQIDKLGLTFLQLPDEVQEMVKRIARFLVDQNRLVVAPRRS